MIDKVTKVAVKYNGESVGYLVELKDGKIAFQYDKKWQK